MDNLFNFSVVLDKFRNTSDPFKSVKPPFFVKDDGTATVDSLDELIKIADLFNYQFQNVCIYKNTKSSEAFAAYVFTLKKL